MNQERRKKLEAAQTALSAYKWEDLQTWLDSHTTAITDVRDEEQESFDNMPEGLQTGDRGQQVEANVESLNNAVDALESAVQNLQNVVDSLNDVDTELSNVE